MPTIDLQSRIFRRPCIWKAVDCRLLRNPLCMFFLHLVKDQRIPFILWHPITYISKLCFGLSANFSMTQNCVVCEREAVGSWLIMKAVLGCQCYVAHTGIRSSVIELLRLMRSREDAAVGLDPLRHPSNEVYWRLMSHLHHWGGCIDLEKQLRSFPVFIVFKKILRACTELITWRKRGIWTINRTLDCPISR